MAIITLALIRVAVHLALGIYDEGFEWLDKDPERYPGRTNVMRSRIDAAVKWCMYEQQFGDQTCLFVAVRGSTLDWGDWAPYHWGDFNLEERPVTFGTTPIRFHTGFYLAAMDFWPAIKDTVFNHKGPVIFTGHSRGGCIAELLHVLASNEEPSKKNLHYSIPCSSTPVVNTFGQALTDNSYAMVIDQDPVSRLSFSNLVHFVNEAKAAGKTPSEVILTAPYSWTKGLNKHVLAVMGNASLWEAVENWMAEDQSSPEKFQITKVLGRIYWLQHESQGLSAYSTPFVPTKQLHEYRTTYESIGKITIRGIGDHIPSYGRLAA
jgi:hypothetical protein